MQYQDVLQQKTVPPQGLGFHLQLRQWLDIVRPDIPRGKRQICLTNRLSFSQQFAEFMSRIG